MKLETGHQRIKLLQRVNARSRQAWTNAVGIQILTNCDRVLGAGDFWWTPRFTPPYGTHTHLESLHEPPIVTSLKLLIICYYLLTPF